MVRPGDRASGALGLALAACLAVCLSSCNIIVTKAPLFSPADSAGAPPLKDGVWVADNDCKYDETKPAETWPGCAQWGVIRGNEVLAYNSSKTEWLRLQQFMLAAGKPLVMQVRSLPNKDDGGFSYVGVEPLAFDAVGNITAFHSWGALCGPPPVQSNATGSNNPTDIDKAKANSSRTLAPLPGLTMDPDNGSDCTTNNPDAVRASAKASKAWDADPGQRAHWVRAGYH